MPDLNQSRKTAHGLILRWGGGIGQLNRSGVKRDATMAIRDYAPRERGGFLDKSVSICISVLPSDPSPDYELDVIEFKGKRYTILLPPGGPRPDGLPVFHDCNFMFKETI
jgi:hypothetical protein